MSHEIWKVCGIWRLEGLWPECRMIFWIYLFLMSRPSIYMVIRRDDWSRIEEKLTRNEKVLQLNEQDLGLAVCMDVEVTRMMSGREYMSQVLKCG